MIEFLAILLGALWFTNAVTSGLTGGVLARRRGHALWVGVVPGGLLPWVGLLVPAVPRGRRSPPRRATSRPVLFAFVPLAAGVLLIGLSLFWDWTSVSGQLTAGEVPLSESFEGGLGDVSVGVVAILAGLGVVVVLAGLLWWRPLLPASVALVFTAAAASSLALIALVASAVVGEAAGYAAKLSAGQAQASLETGTGEWLAIVGALTLVPASMVLLQRTGRSGPRWGAVAAREDISAPHPALAALPRPGSGSASAEGSPWPPSTGAPAAAPVDMWPGASRQWPGHSADDGRTAPPPTPPTTPPGW